ncbi:MAG: DUF493 family protein [Crocinitomicaceae bacterium]|jgi:hypothetical protein|nr:DUF493 family protein [Crocinitomicaceae bacterium]MDG2465046.1 DUF493 family protein [Crocinitomicaceae bacterium]
MGVFDKLKAQLDQEEWPNVYLFKFIVENTPAQIARATSLFDETADISFHESKNGKFVSVTVKEMMLSSEAIISRYEKAAKIKGLISL